MFDVGVVLTIVLLTVAMVSAVRAALANRDAMKKVQAEYSRTRSSVSYMGRRLEEECRARQDDWATIRAKYIAEGDKTANFMDFLKTMEPYPPIVHGSTVAERPVFTDSPMRAKSEPPKGLADGNVRGTY